MHFLLLEEYSNRMFPYSDTNGCQTKTIKPTNQPARAKLSTELCRIQVIMDWAKKMIAVESDESDEEVN